MKLAKMHFTRRAHPSDSLDITDPRPCPSDSNDSAGVKKW
jgi:hypothetical protein